MNFPLKYSEQQQQKKNSANEWNLPQLWDGFMWLIQVFGHLSFKAPFILGTIKLY